MSTQGDYSVQKFVVVSRESASSSGEQIRPEVTGNATDGRSLRQRIGTVAAASALALVAGQIMSLAQTVALARLLTPTEVGYFAAGSIVTSYMSNFVEGGLRAGLIHREDRLEDTAETVFRATLITGFVMSLLALGSAPLVALLFDSRTAGVIAASMSGGILLFSLTNVPEALLQRQFSVKRRLIVGPSVAFTFAVVSVSLAASGFGVWSMVIGSYASSTVWVLTLWMICDWRPGRGRPDWQLYRELVRYGLPLALAQFADQSVKGVQAVVTGRFLGINSLGLLRYGDRMAQIPVGLIVEVAANSLFPAYSRMSSEPERFRRAYLQALGLVVIAGAAISGLLLATGVPLVLVVLGEDWRGAGTVLVTMAGVGIGTALATSNEAIKGAGRTKLINWVTLTDVILGIALVSVLGPLWGLTGVGLSISITSLVGGATLMLMARSILGLTWRSVLATVLPPVFSALVAALVVGWVEREVLHSPDHSVGVGLLLLVVDGLLFLTVHGAVLRMVAPRSFDLVRQVVASVWSSVRLRLGRSGSSA